uniref:Reverse transcriptase Ty1/copia-type domain-containing protein n=1 Tax=Solanum lycopersicum TaxID=4081 RepID=A0A3Q7I567_SOLLC
MREINNLKTRLSTTFEMNNLGPAKQILGMKISRDRSASTLNLCQEFYIDKVVSRFRVNDAKPRTTPLANHFKLSKEQSPKTVEECDHMTLVPYASAVGSLMYVMVCTRPDIAHAVGVVSTYMANPGKEHWEAMNTSHCFGKGKVTLQAFVDADLGGDVDSSKSTSGPETQIPAALISRYQVNQSKVICKSAHFKDPSSKSFIQSPRPIYNFLLSFHSFLKHMESRNRVKQQTLLIQYDRDEGTRNCLSRDPLIIPYPFVRRTEWLDLVPPSSFTSNPAAFIGAGFLRGIFLQEAATEKSRCCGLLTLISNSKSFSGSMESRRMISFMTLSIRNVFYCLSEIRWRELPPTKTIKEVMSFLERLNYISRLIAQSTVVYEPIFKLLKKDAPTKCTKESQTTFDAIKNYLSNPLVLVPLREGVHFVVFVYLG